MGSSCAELPQAWGGINVGKPADPNKFLLEATIVMQSVVKCLPFQKTEWWFMG